MKPQSRPLLGAEVLSFALWLTVASSPAAHAQPVLDERFDDGRALARWQSIDGATVGSGARSEASIDRGALRLHARKDTGRWVALQRVVPVTGLKTIRVSARMRTKGVDPQGARYVNCNVFVRFDGGPVAPVQLLTGTRPWTNVSRSFAVPANARAATIGLFLSMPGTVWFDDVRVETDARWREHRFGHYVYRTLPGDEISATAQRYNEESFRLVSNFLGVSRSGPFTYHKYPNEAAKRGATSRPGNAHWQGDAIHSIWPTDRHEIVHILAQPWGDPPALLAEGLAVHLSGGWQGEPVASYARKLLDRGEWIPLADLVDSRSFRSRPDLATYAIAGAFVEWVVANRGKGVLRHLYGKLQNRAPGPQNRAILEQGLGASMQELDERLRKRLRSP